MSYDPRAAMWVPERRLVLGFTERCGRGASRGRPVRETGTSKAGTPWSYSARYSKDPCDGETDEDYDLRFGGIEFSYSCFNHERTNVSISGPGFGFSWPGGDPESLTLLHS